MTKSRKEILDALLSEVPVNHIEESTDYMFLCLVTEGIHGAVTHSVVKHVTLVEPRLKEVVALRKELAEAERSLRVTVRHCMNEWQQTS